MITQNELNKSLKTNSNQIAVEENGKRILYSQILTNANKITNYLLSKKVTEQSNIGIQSTSVVDMVCAMIGIMNARCVFVPLDKTLPHNRLKDMMASLKPACIIGSDDFFEGEVFNQISQYDLKSIYENTNDTSIPYPDFDENDSLYIYFTSGTTGVPKGIVGRNCGLLQFLKWEIKKFDIANEERFSQFISPYFDAFLRDVFVPLLSGSTICVPPKDEDFFTSEKIVSWIDEQEISVIHCVPSIFRIFNTDEITADNYKKLSYVLLSGEKINPFELKKWYETFENRIQLVNFYGTTETTMIRCCYLINPNDTSKSKIPIGDPIDATEILILNKDLKPCNSLISGDLYISSKYMTKGYLNNINLTQEKFILFNEGASDEKVLFKTGDLARKLLNGSIELLGRSDRQIKLRGIRVELDEIENTLMKCDLIQNSVVVSSSQDDESIIAYFIPKTNISSTINIQVEIEKYVEKNLPSYMRPSQMIEVEGFPMLSNGKINLKALQDYKKPKEVTEPVNTYESRVLKIWKDILGDRTISTDESFQSAGGNSLLLMRLIGKLYTEFGTRITLAQLFNSLTIQQQGVLVQDLTKDKDNVYVISKAETKTYYPLSSSQKTIYFDNEMKRDTTAYNMPLVWEIAGQIDPLKIENIIKELISRHESLRTALLFVGDNIMQTIKEEVEFNLSEIKIKPGAIDNAIVDFCKPFDLTLAPILRAAIFTEEKKNYLIIDMHHIINDGVSQHTLYNDFITLYEGNQLKPLTRQYRDFIEWENQFREGQEFLRLRDFWLSSYKNEIPKLNIFNRTLRNTNHKSEANHFSFTIEKKTIEPLIDGLKGKDITNFSGFFAMLQILMLKITGQEDMVVGITTSGRVQEEVEDIVGVFTKILPIRFKLKGNYTFLDYLEDLKKFLAEAITKQLYDFIEIKEQLSKNQQTHQGRMFDLLFNFQDSSDLKVLDESLQITNYTFKTNTSNYPLEVKVFEGKEVFDFKLAFSTSYFDENEAVALTNELKSLVIKISNNINSKIFDLIEDPKKENYSTEEIVFNF